MSTLICSFDGLHDNRVLRYCADFEAHTLHMDTQKMCIRDSHHPGDSAGGTGRRGVLAL